MHLNELVQTSRAVAATGSRRRKIELLAALLERAEPGEVRLCVAYLSGRLPQGRIGVGPALARRLTGQPAAATPQLRLPEVDEYCDRVAQFAGPGSGNRREALLRELFERSTPAEQHFLAQLLLGELRQGALAAMMAEAVATAAGLPANDIRRAVMVAGDAAPVAEAVCRNGRVALERFRLEPLHPIQPMLAQPGGSLDEAITGEGPVCIEHKLDGARIQVHRQGATVRVFSRRLHDVTDAVPEIAATAAGFDAERFVLDGEALALDEAGRPRPFQETMSRFGRRRDVQRSQRDLPLTPFFFDCLHLSGQDLLDTPLRQRLDYMSGLVPSAFAVERLVSDQRESLRAFAAKALEEGHEGVMIKDLEAGYAAGSRGGAWVKVKPAHTLDLVVLAAEWGHGRRRGWLSNLHLGARAPGSGGFVMLGKTFKGLTDATLEWQTRALRELAVSEHDGVVRVRPELVVEIAFDGLQRSPQYPAGLALRFARVKGYRTDKRAAETDTIDTVRAIHQRQGGSNGR